MALLNDDMQKEVRTQLAVIKHPVKMIYFTQELECPSCRETRELLAEVTPLNEHITLEVRNFQVDKAEAVALGVDRIPAIVVQGDEDRGIRLYGMPSGYEFMSLLEALKLVGARDSGLSETSRKALAGLKEPVSLEVYVTPTCPYCPQAVVTAFRMAYESDNVRAAMVEATEFPHLANRYQVRGVPRTVVNEGAHFIEGGVPEARMVQEVMEAVKL